SVQSGSEVLFSSDAASGVRTNAIKGEFLPDEAVKKMLAGIVKEKIQINIIEVKKPDGSAPIIASNIATQIEKRIPFRRAMKQAVEKAGSFETEAVRQAFRDGLTFDGPGGRVRLDPKTQHTTKYFRLGKIRADRQFDTVSESEAPIEPDPYPQIAFPGWSCDWTKNGVTRGAEVDINGNV
ncbi:MAG: transporter substrate-binding protein, partial [Planctomycetota bacterium]